MNSLEILEAEESLGNLMATVHSLTAEIDNIKSLMENSSKSLEMLDKYGASAIPQLNLDRGLESLMGVPESNITVEAAKEALTAVSTQLAKDLELKELTLSANVDQLISNEGFWRRLTYTFTTDFRCAKKIDELIAKLEKMSPEEVAKLESVKLDYKGQLPNEMKFITEFANVTFKWVAHECDTIKNHWKGWRTSKSEKQEIRQWAFEESRKFRSKYDMLKIAGIIRGNPSTKSKTLKEIGYSKSSILETAKTFKNEASGNLKNLRKTLGSIRAAGTDTSFGGTIDTSGDLGLVVTETISGLVLPLLSVLDEAIKSYKCIDYFLYYISKEV